jgi:NADH:ubiquinone oxidoreductase subunit K
MTEAFEVFKTYWIFVVLLALSGVYCVVATRNLIRVLIGMELMTKAATLIIVVGGWVSGRMVLAQALVINLIVVEVVVIAVAAGLVVSLFRKNGSLDTRELKNLKG